MVGAAVGAAAAGQADRDRNRSDVGDETGDHV
jgi:hypothetical protein